MQTFAKRFHLIAISAFAGYWIHAAAHEAGIGNAGQAFASAFVGVLLVGAAAFFSMKFIK